MRVRITDESFIVKIVIYVIPKPCG